MPNKPLSHSESKRLTGGRVSEQRAWRQQVQPHDRTLMDAERLRHTRRWKRVRRLVLVRDPLCRDPSHAVSGRQAVSTQVDHILPLRERPDLAYTLENLQGLCARCHTRKTLKES